ncbi:unnamed protein product [Prunus armeniaca]
MSMNPNQSLSHYLVTYYRMNLIHFLNHHRYRQHRLLTSMTPPPIPVRRASFLPTSLTDVEFGLQRDGSIAAAPVMNPRAPNRILSEAAARARASMYSMADSIVTRVHSITTT